MQVTNISKALQGVNAKSGRVFIRPGEAKEVEFDAIGLKQLWRLTSLLSFEKSKSEPAKVAEEAKSVVDVLEMAGGNFMAFKSAASKLLGDATPSKKDEIVAALEELATKPEA